MDNANVGNSGATAKRKLKWTPELHSRFMDAIIILGGIQNADVVPSQILELMNVPGLTRENVASHLQKYRKLKRMGSQRINKLARLDEQYNIQQHRQLEASSSYSSHHASSNGCHLGVSLSEQDESMFYQQNHPYWNAMASSGGSTIIQHCSSHFLSGLSNDSCCLSSSSNDNYNVLGFGNTNAVARNYDQTEASFVKNENLQVEGSNYLMSELAGYIFPKNEDNNSSYSPYSAQGMDQEIAAQMPFASEGENYNYYYPSSIYDLLAFDDNAVGQDNSGGNHFTVDLTNDFTNQHNINQQIGNEYPMNYSYGSVEPEPWHGYPLLGSQPSLQRDHDDEDFVQSLFA